MPLYSDCGFLPFGLSSTEAENSGVCDVNTTARDGKCVIAHLSLGVTSIRDKCVVDVWNIFTQSSCPEKRENISTGKTSLRSDLIMNAIAHCEEQPEAWSSMSKSMTGCYNRPQLKQMWNENALQIRPI